MRGRKWLLEYAGEGIYNVVRAGRRLRSNITLTMALRYVRINLSENDSVFREEKDGYQVKLSKVT